MAGEYNFGIKRGDSIRRRLRIRGRNSTEYIDFDGQTGRAHIRDAKGDRLLAQFTVSTGYEEVEVDGAPVQQPYIEIYLPSSESEKLEVDRLPYDVEMTDVEGDRQTWVSGWIDVEADHTRDDD